MLTHKRIPWCTHRRTQKKTVGYAQVHDRNKSTTQTHQEPRRVPTRNRACECQCAADGPPTPSGVRTQAIKRAAWEQVGPRACTCCAKATRHDVINPPRGDLDVRNRNLGIPQIGILPNVSIVSQKRGCKFGAECSFPHWKVEEQRNKRPKRGGDKKCSSSCEKCATVGLRATGR